MTALTVVVPAHDEEALIEPAVRSILGETSGAIDVVVVANGCRDRTAERAHRAGARVIDVPEASKIRALNAGTRAIEAYPVAFVDADVEVAGEDLIALAARLSGDERLGVASPRMRVIPSTSWWVRRYYEAWALVDYRMSGHISSGVYMLSRAGQERVGKFPDVIADDLYVQRLFAPDERLTPDDLVFGVRAPGSLRSLLRRNTRIAAGNLQLAALFPALAPPSAGTGARSLAARVARRPRAWIGFVVYTAVYLLARARAQRLLRSRHAISWNRDETTRRR